MAPGECVAVCSGLTAVSLGAAPVVEPEEPQRLETDLLQTEGEKKKTSNFSLCSETELKLTSVK